MVRASLGRIAGIIIIVLCLVPSVQKRNVGDRRRSPSPRTGSRTLSSNIALVLYPVDRAVFLPTVLRTRHWDHLSGTDYHGHPLGVSPASAKLQG